jgi:hypothetical protein
MGCSTVGVSSSRPCINEPRPPKPPINSEKRHCHSRWRHASGDLLRSGLCVARSISARRENNSDRRVVARSTRKVAALEAGARSQTLGRIPRRIHDPPIEAAKLRFRHASRVNRGAIASGLSSGHGLWCAPVGLPCSLHIPSTPSSMKWKPISPAPDAKRGPVANPPCRRQGRSARTNAWPDARQQNAHGYPSPRDEDKRSTRCPGRRSSHAAFGAAGVPPSAKSCTLYGLSPGS